MNVGVTGHQMIGEPQWIKGEIFRILDHLSSPITGVTSLAIGADQLFAQAVLESGGSIHVIVPCEQYLSVFEPLAQREYQRLLSLAAHVKTLPIAQCDEAAYYAAGKEVVDASDFMVAVWDGLPSRGLGGSGDIVTYCRSQGKAYAHINPVSRETVLQPSNR